jgi:hypothetical protein
MCNLRFMDMRRRMATAMRGSIRRSSCRNNKGCQITAPRPDEPLCRWQARMNRTFTLFIRNLGHIVDDRCGSSGVPSPRADHGSYNGPSHGLRHFGIKSRHCFR